MSRLSQNIKARRKALGLTPRRAAESTDISIERWKDIEAGAMPDLDELESIGNALRVAPHILTGWRPEGMGILMRREADSIVIEWEKPYRFVSSEVLAADGYICIEFEEAEE